MDQSKPNEAKNVADASKSSSYGSVASRFYRSRSRQRPRASRKSEAFPDDLVIKKAGKTLPPLSQRKSRDARRITRLHLNWPKVKFHTRWLMRQPSRHMKLIFRHVIHNVEKMHGTSVSCLFRYAHWLFVVNTSIAIIWTVFVVLPAVITFDYSNVKNPFSLLNVIDGQGPIQQLWFFYGGYSEIAGSYQLWYVYILCIFCQVYISAYVIINGIIMCFEEEGNSVLGQHTYSSLMFVQWDFSITNHEEMEIMTLGITNNFRDYRNETISGQLLERMTFKQKRQRYLPIVGAWIIAGVLVTLGCMFIYWIGSINMLTAYQNMGFAVSHENFVVTFTPSVIFVLVGVIVPSLLYQLPRMEQYISPKHEFHASVIRVFAFKASILIVRLYALRERIVQESIDGCSGTFIGQEMYKIMITKIVVVCSNPLVYLIYWLVKKRQRKKHYFLPPVVQDMLHAQAISWIGTPVFPLMPWFMALYITVSIYVNYVILIFLSRPMLRRWHQTNRSVLFLALSGISLVIVVIALAVMCTADDRFLFSRVIVSNDTTVRRHSGGLVHRDVDGQLYCGPLSFSDLLSPSSSLIDKVGANDYPSFARSVTLLSDGGFLVSVIFILTMVILILSKRVAHEKERTNALSDELEMEKRDLTTLQQYITNANRQLKYSQALSNKSNHHISL